MKNPTLRRVGLLLAVALLATCTDRTPTALPNDEGVEAIASARGAALACDLASNTAIPADVRSFFLMPERQDAQDLARQLGTACGAGNSIETTRIALDLIRMMETAIDVGRAGSVSAGASLTRSLLACTTAVGCSSQAFMPYSIPSATALAKAIGEPTGLFELRGADNVAVVARSAIAFTDDLGRANTALFGTQVSATSNWATANQSPFVFFYGYRTDPTFVGEATVANNVGYSFNRWPDVGTFLQDDVVHVGACFAQDVGFVHAPGEPDPKGRMQREGTLLSEYTSLTFCPPAPQLASMFAPVKLLAARVLPRSWSAMFFGDTRTPIVGGSALDFSNFAPAGVDAAGHLEWLSGPNAVTRPGESIGPITIKALSGGSTPMERVLVTVYIAGNQGAPADAVLYGPNTGYTVEADGTVVIDGLHINKTGGYTLCARGELAGFTFTEACTPTVFHIRN